MNQEKIGKFIASCRKLKQREEAANRRILQLERKPS